MSSIEVHPITAHGYALGEQQLALALPFWNAPIRSNDPMPGKPLVRSGQNAPDQTRRARVDVAVRLDRPCGDVSNSVEDSRDPQFARRPL